MARDLFAEIGGNQAPAASTQPSDGPRDLFAEISFKPQAPGPRERSAATPRAGKTDDGTERHRSVGKPREGKRPGPEIDTSLDRGTSAPVATFTARNGLGVGVNLARASAAPETPQERFARESQLDPSNGLVIGKPQASYERPDVTAGTVAAGLGRNFAHNTLQQALGVAQAAVDFTPGLSQDTRDLATDKITDWTNRSQQIVQQTTPGFKSQLAEDVYDAGANTLQQVPTMAAAILTGNPMVGIAGAGAQTAAQSYGKYRQRGGTAGEAALGAGLEGGLEMLGEKLPMGTLVDKFGKAGAKHWLAEFLGQEMASEQATTLAQDAVDTAIANPNKTWGDYIAERPQAAYQTALAVAVMGGTVGAANAAVRHIDRLTANGRLANRNPADLRDPAPGVRETAVTQAATVTPQDEASPLPTEDIVAGRTEIAKATAGNQADSGLRSAGMPPVGKRVVVDHGDGHVEHGTMEDWFKADDGQGVVVRLDSGKTMREYTDTLADAGVSIREAGPTSEADALDAALAAQAAQPLVIPDTGAQTPVEAPAAPGATESRGKPIAPSSATPRPVADGGAVIRSIFGDKARITSTHRSANDPLTRKNPGSWHAKSNAAVDMAPIPGQTFEQARARIEATGYHLIEAIDEVNHPSGHATGPHWHFVIGEGQANGAQVAAAAATEAGAAAAPDVTTPAPTEDAAPESDATLAALPEPARKVRGEPVDDEWTRFSPESGTIAIPRAEMPQVKAEHRGAMVNFLNARGIVHEEMDVPASSLKPTQAEFSPAKVQKAKDYEGGNRAILTSSDGYVLDGHHQWMAALDQGESVRTIRLDAPIRELVSQVHEMPSSTVADGATSAEPSRDVQAQQPEAEASSGQQQERPAEATSTATVEVTPSGKGAAVIGASEAELAAIAEKVPQAKATKRADGAMVYSAKHIDAIRDAIAGVTKTVAPTAFGSDQSNLSPADKGRADYAAKLPANSAPAEYDAEAKSQWREGYDSANRESILAAKKKLIEDTNAAMPEGYRLEASHSGHALVGPNGMVGGYLAPQHVSHEVLQKVARDALRKARESAPAAGSTDQYENQGAAAFANGESRVPPVHWSARMKESFIRGWDRANLAAPVDDAPAPKPGTAPEHALVGVDDAELSDIVRDFEDVRRSQGVGENQVTHVFDPPAKGEVVRLADKVKVYHAEHGWMTPAEAAARIAEWKAHAEKQGGPGSPNADKVVLSLFDLSGEWSKPWDEAGYQVYRFDIQDDPEVGDVHNFSTEFFGDWFGDFEGQDIYAILAACPCTDFAVSGARHFAAKDADGRTVASVKLVHQTLATIEHFKPAVWAIENPVGRIEKLGGLPPWRLSFDPNHLGETYTKKTLIWGRFNGDLPIAPVDPVEGSKMHKQYGGKSMATKNARSVTPEGFAYSFFMANNAVDHPVLALAGKYDRLDRDVLDKAIKAGVKPEEISEAVDDHYYMEMDDEAANQAVRDLIEQRRKAKMGARPAAPTSSLTPGEQAELDRLKVDNANGDLGDDADVERMLDLQKKATPAPKAKKRPKDDENPHLRKGERVRVTQEIPGEYVRAGETYLIERADKGSAYFRNVESGGGTSIQNWRLKQALASGAIERIEEPAYRGPGETPNDLEDAVLALSGDQYVRYLEALNPPPPANRNASTSRAAQIQHQFNTMGEIAMRKALAKPTVDQETQPQNSATPAAEPAPAQGSDKISKFAGNKLFTEDKVAAARARLKEKLNRVNSGIDPELLMDGIVIAGAHIEAGVRRFADVARALADDLGADLATLKPYLRAWYNGARDMLEDSGEDVSDMDGPGAVKAALTMIEDQATSPRIGAMEGGDAELQDRVPASDAGSGPGDVQGTAPDRSDGSASPGEDRGSQEAVRGTDRGAADATERGAGESAGRGERGRAGVRDADNLPAGQRDAGPARAAARVKGEDWSIEPGSLAENRSAMQKARDNVDAIELVKKIEAEGRPATREEQATIARYVGWGGLKNVFPDTNGQYGKGFEELGARLRAALTDEEYETARRSIQYAHYTAETVVRSMWNMAEQLGFRGGLVFEPGMGTGNFRGMMPAQIAAASSYQGIEYDHLTASIAKLLYPQSGVRRADYTATPQILDTFDLVIGNPPFSETTVAGDPVYGKHGFLLHDFFFAKSLDAVKPGGLLMFVTSAGTMNKVADKARAYLAERADLVGAIRLPGNAFEQNAGTSVTTDIVILRKRAAGEAASDSAWTGTAPVNLRDREGNAAQGNVNRYFIAHPEMILGEQGMFDKLVAGPRYAVRAPAGFDLGKALAEATARLPANILGRGPVLDVADTAPALDLASDEKKDGSFYIGSDGRLMQYRGGVGRAVEGRGKGVTGGMSAKDQEKVRALVPIKDALRAVYAADIADDAEKGAAARQKLNDVYDAFVKKFGPINKTEVSFRRPSRVELEGLRAEAREEARLAGAMWDDGSFDVEPLQEAGASMAEIARAREEARAAAKAAGRIWNEGSFDPEEVPDKVVEKYPNLDAFLKDDEEGYRLAAIEHYNKDTGEAAKGRAFFENAVKLDSKPTINSADDALLYSLNRLGRPEIGTIADMAGKSRSEVLEELADRLFEVPGKPGVYETAETYLSGNVREKLALARQEAARDPAYTRNVKALEAAMPAPLTPSEIAANLGMPWLPTDVIQQFATEALGLESAKVTYLPKLAQWTAAGDTYSAAARSTWGTERLHAMDLIEAALNRQTPQVFNKTDDGKRVLDPTATQAAQDKLAEIKQAFRDWIWKDEARAERLTTLYNEQFNSLVAPRYDGSYLTTPGIASGWEWRPHQRAVVARIIQAGNTYMAHEVGAGKTSAMIGAGMEMKRLGLVNKPMYVVPNHMLGQFTKEFYEQYPLARIRVADETRFHTSRRKEFIARMAADDLDAVIITHSAFGFIPMSDDFTQGMIEQQIDELVDLLSELGKDQDTRITRRKVEQQKEALEQRLKGMGNRKRDQVFTFEETGVDFLFVDEAHLFRKLDFATKMGNVKGIDPKGSGMSFDLYAKTRYLEQQKPGRNLVLASGTPITNTMAELYSVSRYLQQAELDKRQLGHFDAWAGAFGDTKTELEQDPAGGYKAVTRFSQFVNVPELSVMVRQVMDVVGAAELRQYVSLPTLTDGGRQMIMAEQTPDQADYQQQLAARMEAIKRRSGPPQKGDDILLSVISDGRKAAIDYRLIDASAQRDPDSKLERMIANVAKLHKEFARTPFHQPLPAGKGFSEKPVNHGPATQMIFSDFGINGDFPVHKYIKQALVQHGIPAGQIAIISDFKSHVAKQRLFNDMNEGKVRVLIGSVAKMGTGVNAQQRLRALHNMDPQWYPANDTQRNGRIIRQGNKNPQVSIFDYSTKGTYDSQMWKLMAKKASFIEGFMRGDPTMRDMEDLGEASQYEQAAAMTTSDPRIMDLTEWKQELEKVQRRKMAHEREQQTVKSRIRYAEQDKANAEKLIPLIEADIAKRNLPEGDEFAGKVKGQSHDDRAAFGAAVLDAMDDLVDRAGGKPLREGIGELGGFALVGETHPGRDGVIAAVTIKRAGERETSVKLSTDSGGMTQRLVNALRKFDTELAGEKAAIERANREIADFTPRLGTPFTEGAKADELREKINKLEATLKSESDARDAAAKAAPGEAPKQSIPDDLPVVARLGGAELGKMLPAGKMRMVLLRDRAMTWFADHLLGRTVTASDGKPVIFGKRGMGKSTAGKGDVVLRGVPAIEALITKGVASPLAERSDRDMTAIMFAGIVEIDGVPHRMGAIVREDVNGRRHYDLTNSVRRVPAERPDKSGGAGQASDPGIEDAPGGNWNLVMLDEQDKAPSFDPAELRDELQARLESYGMARKVAVQVVDTLDGAAGEYRNALIRVATDTSQDGTFTLDHEAVHALRGLGLFNQSEWAILAAKAKRDPALMRSIKARYGSLSAEAQAEEAVADMFARHQRGDYQADGMTGRVFKRLARALEAIRNWLSGRGLQSAAGVMDRAASGEIGARNSQAALDTSARESRAETQDMVSLGGTEPTWRGKMAESYEQWRTAMQDRYLPLLKVQREIEEQTGKPLPVSRNPYLGEELMTGRIGARLENLAEAHVEPLFDAMHEEGVTLDELETYLYARHAPERNARIAEINPEFEEGSGSGMTDIEARAVMNRIRREGQMDAMARLAARVDAIRDLALSEQVRTGLLSKKDADELRATYEHYVPLRGFKEVEDADPAMADRINRSGGGINVRGKESKPAYGRRSQADSPVAYLILQAEGAIVRGETNLVAQKFVDLAKANPDDDFWTVNKVSHKQRINEDTGLVERYLSRNLAAADADWTVSAKFGGVERRVTMNRANPAARRLADAMRNLTQHQLDWVTLHLGKLNRFLSAVNTSFNPEFVLTNAFRDLQTAAFNLSGEDVKGLTRGVLKDYRAALAASTRGAFGKHSGEWGKWYDEFTSNGGRVYFNKVENVAEIKGRLQKIAEMTAAKNGEASLRMQAKRLVMATGEMIESLNNGVENAVRLSVYKNARERGLSPVQAASMAKNVTVNFNRRGTAGPALNAAYLFYNASVQGTARILMALRSARVRKMMAGVMVTGAMVELLNAMMSALDDDGEPIYDKVPEYEKGRNIILMLPGGREYVKIPMPYGYNVFWNAGRTVAEIARRGGARWKESLANLIGEAADAFNPIGGNDSLLNLISPTVTDPIVDLVLNRDFTGRPIMPNENQYGPEKPDHQRYWGNVGAHWKAITEALSDVTGGDDVTPGLIDVSPETLEYLFGTAMGSAGAFVDRMAGLVGKTFDPDAEIVANDIPIARKLVGSKPSWYDKGAFYDRLGRIDQDIAYAKGYVEGGQIAEARAFARKNLAELRLEPVAKEARRDMRAIRKVRRELEAEHERGRITDAGYRTGKERVDAAEKRVITAFNAHWNKAMGGE